MKRHALYPIKKSCPADLALLANLNLPSSAAAQTAAPAAAPVAPAIPAAPVMLQIDAAKVVAKVSPTLYGLMTEEINYSYDGGLYAEFVGNRTFQDHADNPAHGSIVQDHGGAGAITLDHEQPLNATLPVSLKLEVTAALATARVGVANDGFRGIPVKPGTRCRASFHAKAAAGFAGPLSITIENNDGSTTFASAAVAKFTDTWQKHEVTLTTGQVAVSATYRRVLSARTPGTVWLDLVPLFPPNWHNRPNGNHPDIRQILADLKPAFLRFPLGNYSSGQNARDAFPMEEDPRRSLRAPGTTRRLMELPLGRTAWGGSNAWNGART